MSFNCLRDDCTQARVPTFGVPTLACASVLLTCLGVATFAGGTADNADFAEIESLIEALASSNEAPTIPDAGGKNAPPDADSGRRAPRYPSGYSEIAQGRVIDARKALAAKGIAAFPQLIEHADDRRYSSTNHTNRAEWENYDVGYTCRRILANQVELYQGLLRMGPTGHHWIPRHRAELKKWWDARRGVDLHDLQLEASQWSLELQKRICLDQQKRHDELRRTFEPLREHDDENERRAMEVSIAKNQEQQQRVLANIELLVERLKNNAKPIVVDWQGAVVNEPDLDKCFGVTKEDARK